MNKKYYNEIEKKQTEYRFRFKTKDEFIKQYGDNWFNEIKYGWNERGSMDYLFGVDYVGDIEYTDGLGYYLFDYVDDWNISEDMLIENTSDSFFTIYNNKKQLVY